MSIILLSNIVDLSNIIEFSVLQYKNLFKISIEKLLIFVLFDIGFEPNVYTKLDNIRQYIFFEPPNLSIFIVSNI